MASDLALETTRVEVMNEELVRLHALVTSTLAQLETKNEVREWALARIEEIQAVILGATFIVSVPPEGQQETAPDGDSH